MSLEKHAKKIIHGGDDLTVVMIITIDSSGQTAMTATIRDPKPEAVNFLNQVSRLVSGKQPLEAVNKLPI